MATVQILSPAGGARVSGKVEVEVKVSGGVFVSDVAVVIGSAETGTRAAGSTGSRTFSYTWDTTERMDDGHPSPSDSLFWISAKATVDGIEVDSPRISVTTANHKELTQLASSAASGWRPELAWAANYSGSLAQWKSSHNAVIGASYATLQNDPVLGSRRRVIKASVPESAKDDPDQATETTVRFQSCGKRNIVEGDEFCVGFAFMPPADFPRVYPPKDPSNPHGPEGTSYIAIFQFYGPPYVQGSPFVLHANRTSIQDPVDEFVIRGNELNPGDPAEFLAIPYRRGRWTDVVFRFHVSTSIDRGWVEAYVNQGESTAVRPVQFSNGLHRVPRVLLRPESEAFRTDLQVYRVIERFERVSMWFAGHQVTRTVVDADPRSYRDGIVS